MTDDWLNVAFWDANIYSEFEAVAPLTSGFNYVVEKSDDIPSCNRLMRTS